MRLLLEVTALDERGAVIETELVELPLGTDVTELPAIVDERFGPHSRLLRLSTEPESMEELTVGEGQPPLGWLFDRHDPLSWGTGGWADPDSVVPAGADALAVVPLARVPSGRLVSVLPWMWATGRIRELLALDGPPGLLVEPAHGPSRDGDVPPGFERWMRPSPDPD
ncbi:MAG: hypothetical protein ACLGIR_03850 [Actinomycetes bacterium]